MTTIITVEYICQEPTCGKPFQAKQGSRTRYCPECMLKRVLHPENRGRKGKGETRNYSSVP